MLLGSRNGLAAWLRVTASSAICLAVGVGAGAVSDRPEPVADWKHHASGIIEDGFVERFVAASESMLGTPYENGPLGEGREDAIDPDPRADFGRVDCVTYLEQALALAVTTDPEGPFLENLDAIRYASGRVDYVDRNHYMVTDWIPQNDWLLRDVTAVVAPGLTETVTRTIDRASFLAEHGARARPGTDDPRELTLEYIPGTALSRVEDGIRAGDLIFWVGRGEGIFVVHTGLAVRDDEGELVFRHGSSRAGRVLDECFADYTAAAGFALGFVVLRPNDDAPERLAERRRATP